MADFPINMNTANHRFSLINIFNETKSPFLYSIK